MKTMNKFSAVRFAALLLAAVLALILPSGAAEEDAQSDWVNFLLICNEGMNNSQGNAGNTLMVVAMQPDTGTVKLVMFTWDTFVDYEGYDVPQKLDMPYRNNGAEEAMKVFNANFGTDIKLYMSLNYLNLASLIDSYGGITIDISRAERNALNGMVGSKKNQLQAAAESGTMSQQTLDMLAQEYYLSDFGPDTHLSGLQAVGYGWLQYDSVYNCCEREVKVVANMFHSVSTSITQRLLFYTDASGYPDDVQGRRAINLDNISEEDYIFIMQQIAPIFQMSYNNLSEEDIRSITFALSRAAYEASRQGVDVLDSLDWKVMPLEAKQEYQIIAGSQGHIVDKEANAAEIRAFLYGESGSEQ